MKYPTVFHLISTEFKNANIPFLLIGGFAVNYYGATRFTADIDFLISDEDYKKAATILTGGGYQCVVTTNLLFSRFESKEPDAMDVDLVFVDRHTMAGMLREANEAHLEGIKFQLPSLNHLIALKLHSVKHNPEHREYRDLGDIIELIKRNKINFRSEDFMNLCTKYGPEKLHEKIKGALASWKS